ncbi:Endonuclease/exonuclease/phosphatase [Dichotomocladium elegans]|nr:Endonuclease/exonuclease/phosphatase [Dichotomocladium elegans]
MHASSDISTFSGNTSSHVVRQLSYAQISRQSSSPHHHARTAAAMARNTPVSSAVTITDPNNPHKTFNGLIGKVAGNGDNEHTRMGAKPPTTAAMDATSAAQTWTTLDMGGLGLKNISAAVCDYQFLTVLYLNHNNLTYLPSAMSKLVNLRTLDVSGNKLTSIPGELGMLVQLRELLLFDNNLVTLPFELGSLYQLETLGLEGNPIHQDIKDILIKDGSAAVIQSLRENAPVGMPPPQREWITIESSGLDDDESKFTVLCYNILCQKYATSQAYGYTPSWALDWEYRKELIMTEILGWDADIVCLQELSLDQYEDVFREEFRERGDYDSVFYPKSRAKTMSGKERGQVDGSAIFFKASRFQLLEVAVLEYNQKALQRADFKKCADIYNRVMTKDNIGVLAMLENKETLERVLVATSHIHWDPTFADVKLVQVGMLMDEIDKFATRHLQPPASSPNGAVYTSTSKLPTIIAGDFNSEPESGVYEFLSKGVIKERHDDFGDYIYGDYTTEGLSHKLSLKSAYASIGELPFTNYTPGFKGVLDYIWVTTNTLDVISLLGAIDKDYLNRVVGFPNAHFPSE